MDDADLATVVEYAIKCLSRDSVTMTAEEFVRIERPLSRIKSQLPPELFRAREGGDRQRS